MADEEKEAGKAVEIRDFDAVVPEPRLCRIGGERVNVAIIPTRQTLALARFVDRQATEDMSTEDTLGEIMHLVAEVCKVGNPKVDEDFLLDHTHFAMLMDFINFVLEPLRKEGEESGNPEPADSS